VLYIFLLTSSVLATVTISVALRHMKRVKRTTKVFLANLAVSILLQGVTFLLNTILRTSNAFDEVTCLVWVMLFVTPSAHYLTGILFVYLDLYLSLKWMSIGRPIISARVALAMSSSSLLVWSAICSSGFGMRDADYVYDDEVGCDFLCGVVLKHYVLLLILSFCLLFGVIVVLHVLTYRLITKPHQQLIRVRKVDADVDVNSVDDRRQQPTSILATTADVQTSGRWLQVTKSRWIKRNSVVLKTITLIVVVLTVTWCPLVVLSLVILYCESYRQAFYTETIFITYILVAIQYHSNGIIYLVKIKELQMVCKRIWCRCHSSKRRVEPIERDIASIS